MRKKIVAGNWKMNKTLAEGVELVDEVCNKVNALGVNDVNVIMAPSFILLTEACKHTNTDLVSIAAQNCAAEASGAYTGEVSAAMVASTGCKYVILGHSERRSYYGDTDAVLVKKVALAMENGLNIIFCIGEVLEDRESGNHFEVVKSQLVNGIFQLSPEAFSHVVIAYEPVWAIGTGKTATAGQAQEMHAFIRSVISGKYGEAMAKNVSILYGGSCNAKNADELFVNPDVDGGLIGGASLKADDFMAIVRASAKS